MPRRPLKRVPGNKSKHSGGTTMLMIRKRNAFAGLSAAVLLATGQLAGAAEPGELEARIAALEAQLEALKTAVATAKTAKTAKTEGGAASVGPPETATASAEGATGVAVRLETLSIGQTSLEETMALSHVTKRDDTWFRYGGYVQLDALMT